MKLNKAIQEMNQVKEEKKDIKIRDSRTGKENR